MNLFGRTRLNTSVFILNLSLTSAVPQMTPLQAYSGKKPSTLHLHTFVCICRVHVPDKCRTKLDAKSRRCIFIAYTPESKANRLYDLTGKMNILSSSMEFDEGPRISDRKIHHGDDCGACTTTKVYTL